MSSSSSQLKRKIFIAGNWKSNGDRAFVNKHCMFLTGVNVDKNTTELCLAPSNIYLLTCKTFLAHLFNISAQNISQFDSGPYTGEVSAKQIKDLDVDWTMIGYSERRKLFNEDEVVIGKKIEQALNNKLNIILCIGDNKEAKENNKSNEMIKTQLNTGFEKINSNNWENVVIAYEPIWENEINTAITKEKVQEIHEFIRNEIKEKLGEEIAEKVRIIFGGNVDENNCNELIVLKDVDGFLVGEPSIKATFNNIIYSAKLKKC
jgi:triosephosphate isomerase